MATLAYQSARLKRLFHEGLSAFGLKKGTTTKKWRVSAKAGGVYSGGVSDCQCIPVCSVLRDEREKGP